MQISASDHHLPSEPCASSPSIASCTSRFSRPLPAVSCSATSTELGASLKPLGDAFIKLVKMIIAPVIFLTVATGIAGMSDLQKVGRVAGKAMLYFLTFSTLALVIGLVVSNVVQPGTGMHIDPATLDTKAIATYAEKAMTRRSSAS